MSGIGEGVRSWLEGMPALAEAAILLAIGWLVAAMVRLVVSWLLTLVRFDKLGERTGLSEFLRKGKVKYSPSRLAGVICYWATLLAVFLAAAKTLDLDIYTALSGKLSQALPNVAAGALVAIVGYLVVSFVSNFALTIALNASVQGARFIARGIKWFGIIIVITMALEQVGLGRSIIEFVFEALIASVAFGAALAFGLGCKDMAQGSLKRFLNNLREREREGRGPDLEG